MRLRRFDQEMRRSVRIYSSHITPHTSSFTDISQVQNVPLKLGVVSGGGDTKTKALIKTVYGDKGWPFLEESGYLVVQEALFEKQEQEEKLQLQLLQEEQQVEEAQEPQQEWEDDNEVQQLGAATMGTPPESDMPIVKVHNEVPSETVLAIEQTEELVPMIIDPPAPKAALPHPTATGSGRTRPPCYGWISESESASDYEEFLANRQQQVHVPSLGGDRSKRKRPSRWDVK